MVANGAGVSKAWTGLFGLDPKVLLRSQVGEKESGTEADH